MKSFIKRLARMSADRLYVAYLRGLNPEKPYPLRMWVDKRKMFGVFKSARDPLFNKLSSEVCAGSNVEFLPYGAVQENDVIGEWTMSKAVMKFLLEKMLEEKPRVIMECGSGLSSILLAHYASIASADGFEVLVVSLEQDKEEVGRNMSRLRSIGLESYVKIIHAPTDAEGNYLLDAKAILSATRNSKVDCLIIDGPSGPEGCRISTLPFLSEYCSRNARWYLDDALRDGELNALVMWAGLSGCSVEGIYPFSKGLAVGRMNCLVGRPSGS